MYFDVCRLWIGCALRALAQAMPRPGSLQRSNGLQVRGWIDLFLPEATKLMSVQINRFGGGVTMKLKVVCSWNRVGIIANALPEDRAACVRFDVVRMLRPVPKGSLVSIADLDFFVQQAESVANGEFALVDH